MVHIQQRHESAYGIEFLGACDLQIREDEARMLKRREKKAFMVSGGARVFRGD